MTFPILEFFATPAPFSLRKISAVLNVLATGTNHEDYGHKKNYTKKQNGTNNFSCAKSVHAEETAIDKIQKNTKRKRINVSLLVIRISPASTVDHYHLSNSRPCVSCMSKIKNMSSIGYKISKIYFSNGKGEIVCHKLRDILREKQHLSRYYRQTIIPKRLREFELAQEKRKL